MTLDLSKYIARMERHIAADELVRGIGWEEGKGCFIGCTFDYYDHERGAAESGIPEWVLRLCDNFHESMSDDIDRGAMALRLLTAFERVEDFEAVRHKINLFIMGRNRERVEALDIDEELKKSILGAINKCSGCHSDSLRGIVVSNGRWITARSAAKSAAESAKSAAESARSARSAWSAAWSAWSASWTAAWSARSAAWSARSAAESARSAAWSAWSASWSARSAAESAWSAAESAENDAIGAEFLRLVEAEG